jgi:hypothetical protein
VRPPRAERGAHREARSGRRRAQKLLALSETEREGASHCCKRHVIWHQAEKKRVSLLDAL